jgi:hypothetical protein
MQEQNEQTDENTVYSQINPEDYLLYTQLH